LLCAQADQKFYLQQPLRNSFRRLVRTIRMQIESGAKPAHGVVRDVLLVVLGLFGAAGINLLTFAIGRRGRWSALSGTNADESCALRQPASSLGIVS
jgi:hypothetical protein